MLTLYEPKCTDLWFRQMMLADEETMSYNRAWGGTIPFPEEDWKGWHDHWVVNHDGKRYYRYLKNEDGMFVGEIAYHYDADLQHYAVNVIVYSKYRRKGYGSELSLIHFTLKEMSEDIQHRWAPRNCNEVKVL